jgi:hypothetical protein
VETQPHARAVPARGIRHRAHAGLRSVLRQQEGDEVVLVVFPGDEPVAAYPEVAPLSPRYASRPTSRSV